MLTLLCSGMLIREMQNSAREQILQQQHAIAQTYASLVESYFYASQEALELTAQQPALSQPFERALIQPTLHGVAEDAAPIERTAAQHLLDSMPRFNSVSLLTDNFDVYAMQPYSVQQSLPVGNLGKRDFYQAARSTGHTAWGSLFTSGDIPLVVLATPIKNEQGDVQSILGAGLDLSALARVASGLHLGDTTTVMLFDARGVPVVYPDPERIVAAQPLTEFPLVADALNGDLGARRYFNPVTNQDELGAVVKVGHFGWYAAVTQTHRAAFVTLDRLMWVSSTLVVLSTLLVGLGGILMARSISRAVGQVEHAARGIAEGDLDQQLDVRSKDELGRMADAFRTMVTYQQRMATIADAIAAGDLTVDAQPLSPRDRLGVALQGMIRNLRQLVDDLQEREQRYRYIIETTQEGVWMADAELRTTFANGRLGELLGCPPDELIGKRLDPFVTTDHPMPLRPSPTASRQDLLLRRADGTLRWAMVSSTPLFDQEHNVVGCFAMATDITERKEAEEALRIRDRAMAATTTAVAITEVRAEGHPAIYVNPAFENMTGYAATDIVGKDLRFLGGPDGLTGGGVAAEIADALRLQRDAALTALVHRQDGTPFWADLIAAPVRNDRGDTTHYVWLISDVTERKHAEQQSDALARTEKLRALGQMASGIAHDLNQSLMLIASYSELSREALDQQPIDVPEVREMFGIVSRAARDGGETVKRLLMFTRAPAEAEVQPIDVAALVRETAQLTAPRWRDATQAEGRPVSLIVDVKGQPVMLGSPARMREILTNLVFNAVDALPAGGAIRLNALERDGRAVIEVADTGVGMTDEIKAHIFEPFFSTKGDAGTGLGLAMVFGVVESHQGSIDVDSAPGRGTRFCLSFPMAATPRVVSVRSESTESTQSPPRALRILAVDDEPAIGASVKRALRSHGHSVVVALSGEAALEQLATERFDVLVSDVGMGAGMNGWELAAAARGSWPHLRIVLATGWGAIIDAEEAHARGVDAVLAKPYVPDELRRAIAA
ncbi:MAG TPA: PAS domain S-box protein [Chloroflexota bacterium]